MSFNWPAASLMTSLVDAPAQALANMSMTTYLATTSASCRLAGAGHPGKCQWESSSVRNQMLRIGVPET